MRQTGGRMGKECPHYKVFKVVKRVDWGKKSEVEVV
jgi:hypothetical protein